MRTLLNLVSLVLVCFTIRSNADLWFEQRGSSKVDQKTTNFSRQVWLKKKWMRGESTGSAAVASTMIANEDGMFACALSQKICTKMPYRNGASHIFAGASAGIETISLSLKSKGTSRKVAGFKCDEYQVERVTESKRSGSSPRVRTKSVETNCYSVKFRDLLPTELIAEFRKSIREGGESSQIKKLLMDEFNLGAAVKQQASTVTYTQPNNSSNNISLSTEIVSVKTDPIEDHLFRVPKGYKLNDMSKVIANQKQRQGSIQLDQLRQMRNSGKLSKEQQQQVDMVLKQLESSAAEEP